MRIRFSVALVLFCIFLSFVTVEAQTKKRKFPAGKSNEKKEATKKEATAVQVNQPESSVAMPQKKNQRSNQEVENLSKEVIKTTEEPTSRNRYFYEFEAPKNFQINRIQIEHDENGIGRITFWKRDLEEEITESINLSKTTLEKVKSLFRALNFLDSNEEYQSAERNYSHLGVVKISLKTPDKERSVQFNWTERKEARELADEYRRIGNQFIWQFEINLARENQPLEAPSLMDKLDVYLRRNEIADPLQMLPLLEELMNDERIPLMARNRAKVLVERIRKISEKAVNFR